MSDQSANDEPEKNCELSVFSYREGIALDWHGYMVWDEDLPYANEEHSQPTGFVRAPTDSLY
jgi:hypothetical protein